MSKATNMITYFPTDHGKLPRGGRVLVIGASGGCGIAGLQLAKYLGASEVVAVSSRQNRELVLREGATDHVDYTTTNFADSCGIGAAEHKKFDVVYDCASPYAGGESARWALVI